MSLVAEVCVNHGQESCGWGIIDVEELGGGTDGGGGVVTEAFNGHDVIKTHVLNNKIIKSNQAIT